VIKRLVVVAFAVAMAGCATSRGFDRGKLAKDLSQQTLVTDEDIRKAIELKPQLGMPFRLGLCFKNPERPRDYWRRPDWSWQQEDKDSILGLGEELKEKGIVSEVVYISSSVVAGKDTKAVRYAAAQHGVDAVLVVSGTVDIDRYNNILGPLYILLVTGFFVPGDVIDALFLSHAALWDVRNGYLYLSVEAEAKSSITRPAVFIRESSAIKRARSEALAELAVQIENHIENLAR